MVAVDDTNTGKNKKDLEWGCAALTWADLTEDERRFLTLWRNADADTAADVLAVLLNGRRRRGVHDDDDGKVGKVVNIDARRNSNMDG